MGRDRNVRRDRAGLGPDPAESRRRLVSIDAVEGFRVADGEPDVRGWEVRTLSDRELGDVEDLLIDPDRREVVMLEVALRGRDLRAEVPIRAVQLDRGRKVVVVDSGDVEAGTSRSPEARRPRPDDDLTRDRYAAGDAGADARARDVTDERDVRSRDLARGADTADARRTEESRLAERARHAEGAGSPDADIEERVVERRPIVEEVVVRRRPVDE